MKELKETNALVEEFMLLANISVAQKIYRHYPDCSMLRQVVYSLYIDLYTIQILIVDTIYGLLDVIPHHQQQILINSSRLWHHLAFLLIVPTRKP
jgi:hypothetical protein